MATKRMFSMLIVDSDAFLDMPLSSQCLYFHLNMRADDDGFVGNPKKIMRIIGASNDDFNILVSKRFLLCFESGVIVIKHWRMHNVLSAGRYHETVYTDEKKMLKLKENGSYSFDHGIPIDDSKRIETSKRQAIGYNRRTIDEQKTNVRRTIDEQKTNSDIGLDKDIDIGLDKDIDIESEKEKIDSKESIRQTETVCESHSDDEKPHVPVKKIVEMWNTLTEFGITPVSKIDSKSKRYIAARVRGYQYTEEDFQKAIDNIRHSDFLCGKKTDFIITFDWFVKASNFEKVYDGNYNNRENTSGGSKLDEWLKEE